jgi:uncharacterized protein (DUF305 family)
MTLRTFLALAASALLATGCASSDPAADDLGPEPATATGEPGDVHDDHAHHPDPGDQEAHHGHDDHVMPNLPATGGDGYTATDVHFMQMMIGHHDQALRMARMAPEREAGRDLLLLAQRIDISQRDEIRTMELWLEERGQVVPDEEQRRQMQMPGMVTDAQFEALAAARGHEFDRLFLELMIDHHVGAVQMVDELFEDPRAGQEPEIFRFATDVASDQLDEIHVMERLLAQIDPQTPSHDR